MITERLYDNDAYQTEFSATVLDCAKYENGFKVILDKTAFFPEAGGQPSDKGTINGIKVTDVQIEDEKIVHFCESELDAGSIVSCKIDFERRFAFMQNHSGEHIVSGIVFKKYGLHNVGFHLNEEFVTLDFNGVLERNQIDEIELLANKVIWQNKKIKTYYPSKDELSKLLYRQKKELSGDIRIVEIEDTDMCACCAPHVKSTGEIGLIKLLSSEKMRGGIRIVMKCGEYALKDYNDKFKNVTAIQNLLSAKPEETALAVNNLLEKFNDEKQKNKDLKKKLINYMANDTEDKVLFAENFDIKELQSFADTLNKNKGETVLVFSEREKDNFNFALCGNETETNELFLKLKEKFNARGGGRNGMISGTVNAKEKEIIKEFNL